MIRGSTQPGSQDAVPSLAITETTERLEQRRNRLQEKLNALIIDEEIAWLKRQIHDAKELKAKGYPASPEPQQQSRSRRRSGDETKLQRRKRLRAEEDQKLFPDETPLQRRKRLRREESQLDMPAPPDYKGKWRKEYLNFVWSCRLVLRRDADHLRQRYDKGPDSSQSPCWKKTKGPMDPTSLGKPK